MAARPRIVHGLRDVHIVGAGNSAGQAALFFSTTRASVSVLCRGETLEKSMSATSSNQLEARSNIEDALSHRGRRCHGDEALEAIDVSNAHGETTRLDSGGLFIFIGADAETGWLPPEIALDGAATCSPAPTCARRRWELDRDPYLLETSVPGIFACGDVRFGPVKRVAAAVGEGSMAIAFVHQYLRAAEVARRRRPDGASDRGEDAEGAAPRHVGRGVECLHEHRP
jgi:thioredoxin reductase (NADPH)